MAKVPGFQVLRATVLLVLLAGLATAYGQSPLSTQNQDQNQDQDRASETLKVNVNVVQLFFNVKDKKGALISNLTKDRF